MCGIAGIIFGTQRTHLERTVARMLTVQAHRGPEGSATDTLDDAVFACCQLAFVDIGTSRQPYRSPDRRILLVFNGEIYNHTELRQSLGTPDAPFTVPGEVAVLAALYTRYGLAAVQRLNGMFAIAIFDAKTGETILIRDRFGKKPLYYFVHGKHVAFASELRALQTYVEAPTELDLDAIGLFLTFNAVPAPISLIRGIRKVPPGSIVRIRDGRVAIERYWTPRLQPTEQPWQDAFGQVQQQLQHAVVQRIPHEVPFGVFLSGGLDSGLIAAIAAQHTPTPLRTFSVGFPEQVSFDESVHARALATAIGAEHTVVSLSLAELAEAAIRSLTHIDEPVADQSLVPTELLARVARRDVKAVLTGDGADELLMGYRLFSVMAALRMVLHVLPTAAVQRLLAILGHGRPSDQNLHYAHVARLLARALTEPPERQYYAAAASVMPSEWATILMPAVAHAIATLQPFAQLDRFMVDHPRADPAERLQLGMICHFLRDTILTKLDRATMLASLEARSPFLDHILTDTLLRLPTRWKLHGLTTKYLLKQIAALYLPKHLVHRRKQGFRSPTAALLRGPLLEFTRDMLSAHELRQTGIFQSSRIERLLDEHVRQEQDHHRTLWAVLCLQSWLRAQTPVTVSGCSRIVRGV